MLAKGFAAQPRAKNFLLIDNRLYIEKKYAIVIKRKGLVNFTRPLSK
jgi:hypothetical protein